MEFKIKLRSPEDVSTFSQIINKCTFDIDIASSHTYVDAKSILGLYSLNLNEPIMLDSHGEYDECKELMDALYNKGMACD